MKNLGESPSQAVLFILTCKKLTFIFDKNNCISVLLSYHTLLRIIVKHTGSFVYFLNHISTIEGKGYLLAR